MGTSMKYAAQYKMLAINARTDSGMMPCRVNSSRKFGQACANQAMVAAAKIRL
jgi:hypothetical protein